MLEGPPLMIAVIQEWLNLLVRWIHVVAAIMWIGDSFLFMWLDSHLSKPRDDRDDRVSGELWMTHSGGFYEVLKRKSLKKGESVGTLYWFKWESYTTWITGFLLLLVVYGLGGGALLVDPSVQKLTAGQAIHLSVALLPLGYLVYEGLWATPLSRHPRIFAVVGLSLIVGTAFGLTQVFSARAAFLQVGAMLGTLMTANVFFRIIPAQRHMLAATAAEKPVDTSYGLRAKGRSIQNHYLSLPVLFCMLSNHFPSTYSSRYPWAVLGLLVVVGAGIKYVMNLRGRTPAVALVGTAFALIGVIGLTMTPHLTSAEMSRYQNHAPVSFATVETILQARCLTCHSSEPTHPMFPAPPNGVVFETAEQVSAFADRIFLRAVSLKTMPLANMTGMKDEERDLLGAWFAQGKNVLAPGPSQLTVPVAAVAAVRNTGSSASPAQIATQRYQSVCSACHGLNGDAKTPSADALNPRPRDFTNSKWQSGVNDEDLAMAIIGGGTAVGKSPAMPGNPDLQDKPDVVSELIKLIRGFGAR